MSLQQLTYCTATPPPIVNTKIGFFVTKNDLPERKSIKCINAIMVGSLSAALIEQRMPFHKVVHFRAFFGTVFQGFCESLQNFQICPRKASPYMLLCVLNIRLPYTESNKVQKTMKKFLFPIFLFISIYTQDFGCEVKANLPSFTKYLDLS